MPDIHFTFDDEEYAALEQRATYWVRTCAEQAKMSVLTDLGLRPAPEMPKLAARVVTPQKLKRVLPTNGLPSPVPERSGAS